MFFFITQKVNIICSGLVIVFTLLLLLWLIGNYQVTQSGQYWKDTRVYINQRSVNFELLLAKMDFSPMK